MNGSAVLLHRDRLRGCHGSVGQRQPLPSLARVLCFRGRIPASRQAPESQAPRSSRVAGQTASHPGCPSQNQSRALAHSITIPGATVRARITAEPASDKPRFWFHDGVAGAPVAGHRTDRKLDTADPSSPYQRHGSRWPPLSITDRRAPRSELLPASTLMATSLRRCRWKTSTAGRPAGHTSTIRSPRTRATAYVD